MGSMAEVLKEAESQAADPRQQKRAEELLERLDNLANLKDLGNAGLLAEDIIRTADRVNLVNTLAKLPASVRNNYILAFNPKSANEQFTNPDRIGTL